MSTDLYLWSQISVAAKHHGTLRQFAEIGEQGLVLFPHWEEHGQAVTIGLTPIGKNGALQDGGGCRFHFPEPREFIRTRRHERVIMISKIRKLLFVFGLGLGFWLGFGFGLGVAVGLGGFRIVVVVVVVVSRSRRKRPRVVVFTRIGDE